MAHKHLTTITMGFIESISSAYSNWNNISGRATRSQYWWFRLYLFLATLIIALVCTASCILLKDNKGLSFILLGLFFLFHIVPDFTIRVRRLHDTNKSGVWLLLYLLSGPGAVILLIFFLLPSEMDNRYGPKENADLENYK